MKAEYFSEKLILHGVTHQKAVMLKFTVMRVSHPVRCVFVVLWRQWQG